MKQVLFVFGTRPEAIKLAPIILAAQEQEKLFQTKVLVTGQHREMLDEVLRVFQIKADYDLDIMLPGQSLSQVTSRVLVGVGEILEKENPDLVVVQGDTTTAFTGALAAYYQKIPVAHIEAGLRSGDKYQPFPEEVNRILVSQIADYHFAPTPKAAQNLYREGITKNKVLVTGNTVIDALLRAAKLKPLLPKELKQIDFGGKVILVTAHRRENFGQPLENLCEAIKEICQIDENLEVVYPVHPNPNVKEVVLNLLRNTPKVKLISPLDYLSFCYLMKKAFLILSDSGGIQEEAPSLNKPLLVLREVTERPEVVEAGAAILVGMNKKKIVSEVKNLLVDQKRYLKMASAKNPFGDGRASERIVKRIMEVLEVK